MKRIIHFIRFVPLFVFIIVIAVSCAPTPEPNFEIISNITVTDLGTLPGGNSSAATDINDGGYIVGHSDTNSSGDRRAFVIHAQGMQNLGTLPGGGESFAYGISNNGYIVGSARNSDNIFRAIVVRSGIMRDLGANPEHEGSYSGAKGVNNSGLIVGNMGLSGFYDTGVIWDLNGTPTHPPFPPYTVVSNQEGHQRASNAVDINTSGQVAGCIPQRDLAYRWTSGNLEILKPLSHIPVRCASGINNHGQVVGDAKVLGPDNKVISHAVKWRNPSTIQDLGTLDTLTIIVPSGTPVVKQSYARDINDSGTVVGWSINNNGVPYAFIWRPKLGMHFLGTLGGAGSYAYAINSDGVIVGKSRTSSGEYHATRWDVSIAKCNALGCSPLN